MSVKLMSMVFDAHFHDIEFVRRIKKKSGNEIEKKIKIVASTSKSITVALADHANDEGEGAYPGLSTLEDKTELSRNTVIASLTALKSQGIIFYAGISKYGTNNYTINKKKLAEMALWSRQIRTKVVKPLPEQDTSGSEATALPLVKPLHQSSEATAPEPSFNHHLTLGANAPALPDPRPAERTRRTDAVVRGDPMDGVLFYAAQAEARTVEEKALETVADFPPDCQDGARLVYRTFKLIPPEKPKSGKGGDYAFWINGIRALQKVCAEYNVSLQTGFEEVYKNWNISPYDFKSPSSFEGPMKSALARLSLREASPAPVPPAETEYIAVPMPAYIQRPKNLKRSFRARN